MNFKITISLSILTGYINYNLSSIILITHTHNWARQTRYTCTVFSRVVARSEWKPDLVLRPGVLALFTK